MKRRLFLLIGALSLFTLAGCASQSATVKEKTGKPLEYFQSFNFTSNIDAIQDALKTILESKGYEIQKQDPIQMTALNSEITSVELLTYSRQRPGAAQSVYSGEVLVTVDFLGAPDGGTFVHIKPKIKAIVGRTSLLRNDEWQGEVVVFNSRGDLENEILKELARKLKEQRSLNILITREIELEGGFTLK